MTVRQASSPAKRFASAAACTCVSRAALDAIFAVPASCSALLSAVSSTPWEMVDLRPILHSRKPDGAGDMLSANRLVTLSVALLAGNGTINVIRWDGYGS